MRYSKFYFKNFKGIVEIDLSLENKKSPIALVGLNESGKTTILEGIKRIGIHVKEYDLVAILEDGNHISESDIQNIIPRRTKGFTGDVVLGCVIKDNSKTIHVVITYSIQDSTYQKCSATITINDVPLKDKEKQNEWFRRLRNDLPPIWYYDTFNFLVPDLINFITTKHKLNQEKEYDAKEIKNVLKLYREYVDDKKNRGWQSALDDLYTYSYQETYEKGIFQKKVVDFLDHNPSGTMPYKTKMQRIGSVLTKEIVASWKKISNRDLIKEIQFGEFSNPNLTDGYKSYRVEIIDNNHTTYSVNERSLGFRWYFAFVLFTEIKKVRNKDALFLLDEPASNLHASSQEQILKAINRLAKESTVLYSTHSPYLIDTASFGNLHIVSNEKQRKETKESKIECNLISPAYLEKNPKDQDFIRPVIDHLCFKIPSLLKEYSSQQNETNKPAVTSENERISTQKGSSPLKDFLVQKMKIDFKDIEQYLKLAYYSSRVARWLSELVSKL